MNVSFYTLGCKVNQYETEAMEGLFREQGYSVVPFDTGADVVVINTCTVTNLADKKSRQMIHKARSLNSKAIVAAVGCYVQAQKEDAQLVIDADIIIGNNNKAEIVNEIHRFMTSLQRDVHIEEDLTRFETMGLTDVHQTTRAYIKIQDGCNQFCSYCIIPLVRGRIRSRDLQEILQEIKQLADKGFKEVVLTGIHLSSYGKDKGEGQTLADCIEAISGIQGIERIRLGSLEPNIITHVFLERMMQITAFCPHFHLSLQSGSDNTLKRMNRKYTTEEYLDKVQLIRSFFLDAAITTDIIVGFPGESEADYLQSMAFANKVEFSQIHLFKYSKRQGTQAAQMTDQIDEKIKKIRSHQFEIQASQMNESYRKSFIQKTMDVLIEEQIERAGTYYAVGHTPNYLKVYVQSSNQMHRINEIYSVKITALYSDGLLAT